jgi:hypothetical protein
MELADFYKDSGACANNKGTLHSAESECLTHYKGAGVEDKYIYRTTDLQCTSTTQHYSHLLVSEP